MLLLLLFIFFAKYKSIRGVINNTKIDAFILINDLVLDNIMTLSFMVLDVLSKLIHTQSRLT